ncbi:MAG: HAD hydrolase-like protein [Anaerolineales bacterium]|nr:HAD hydrolase-like protein [Anaerolineales bacterium]
MIDMIAFDADDTLWHNEPLYVDANRKLQDLLVGYASGETIRQKLDQIEEDNFKIYGYGIKSFALSMIQTAVELSIGKISGDEVNKIIDIAKDMLLAEVVLLEGVVETIEVLANSYPLMIITKGDIVDQESKIDRSGIGGYFHQIEIVGEKVQETYTELLSKYGIPPERFLMVGNSLRSDILPVVALGGLTAYIPYELTWQREMVHENEKVDEGYYELESIHQLPRLLARLKSE